MDIQHSPSSHCYFPGLEEDCGEKQTASSKAYRTLKRAILCGELPLDSPISQVKLAEMVGVSRTPLREAINKLQQEQLIHCESNKRIIVPSYTPEDVDQLLAMRIMMECLAVRITVPSMKIAQLDELQDIYDKMCQPDNTAQQQNKLHRMFHKKICDKAGKHLDAEIQSLNEQAVRYQMIYLSKFEFDRKGHLLILDACMEQNPSRVSFELARHYSKVAFRVLNEMDPMYEPIAVRQALNINAASEGMSVGS